MRFRNLEYQSLLRIISASSPETSVFVGCDSKLAGSRTLFGVAVVLHVDSRKGGMLFGKRFLVNRRMPMAERLMSEVNAVIECAFEIHEVIGSRNFEIHLDLNPDPKHKSNSVMKQAISYVKAQGFDYRIKPRAWAASTAADFILG
jgi:uncharacterized protein